MAIGKRIWGWWFFDWASQPYNTLLLTFVFGPYFQQVATATFVGQGQAPELASASAQAYWGWGQSISGVLIACLAPILGALADGAGRRMPWIWGFSVAYVVGAWMLWGLSPSAPDLLMAQIWFGIGLIGMEFATIFTNALMPDLCSDEEMGRVSGSGFAFGYLGGIIALVIMLLFLAEGESGKTLIGLDPLFGLDAAAREGTRSVGPFSALWYGVFMVPFFLWVREVPRAATGAGRALTSLGALIRALPTRPSLFAHLISSMIYRDALNALYTFGGVYAAGVLGWSITQIGVFGIAGALAATVFSWLGGKMDTAKGPKPVMTLSIWVLIAVCLIIAGMAPDSLFGLPLAPGMADKVFYLCGMAIGAAGGTLQSSSRTMMVFHTRPEHATEAFGLYALSGKVTSFIAPAAVALATTLSGSQRIGIAIPLILLFLLGMILLSWVQPKGERA